MKPPPPTDVAAALAAVEAGAGRPMKVKVRLPEEKFTDVAIGVELVDDFHRAQCTLVVLVTNDADFRPAIDKVVKQGHQVHVVSPAATVNRHLRKAATSSTPMPRTCLEDHQCQKSSPSRLVRSSRSRTPGRPENNESPPGKGGLGAIPGAVGR